MWMAGLRTASIPRHMALSSGTSRRARADALSGERRRGDAPGRTASGSPRPAKPSSGTCRWSCQVVVRDLALGARHGRGDRLSHPRLTVGRLGWPRGSLRPGGCRPFDILPGDRTTRPGTPDRGGIHSQLGRDLSRQRRDAHTSGDLRDHSRWRGCRTGRRRHHRRAVVPAWKESWRPGHPPPPG